MALVSHTLSSDISFLHIDDSQSAQPPWSQLVNLSENKGQARVNR